jgi:NADPH:quinone reductase-like Zn-dependent oxidoreductase
MRAVIVKAFGDVEGLSVESVEPPRPVEGMALIKVEASSVAYADTLTRRGSYPPGLTEPGIIVGLEVVGRVVSVGWDSDHDMVGRRVFNTQGGLGSHAEFVNVPLEGLLPVPEEVDPKAVAAFGVTGMIAQVAVDRAGVRPGAVVLVRGAAGGLGSAAVRLARMAGATVVATASSEDRAAYVRQLGAGLVLDREGRSREGDCPPVDVVIDPVGGPFLPTFIQMLAANGRYVLLGAAGGPPNSDFAKALLANFFKAPTFSTLSLHAVSMKERASAFETILAGYKSGKLAPDIDCVVSLNEIRDAHRRIEASENRGKIVLTP